jgi:hypothetical protein
MEWMTAQQTAQTLPQTAQDSISIYGFQHVF